MWCHVLLMSPVIGLGLFLILPWPVALPLYLVIVALSLFLYGKVMQSMRQPVTTGQEGLLGRVAEIGPEGSLKVAGERWLIARPAAWQPGQQVRIIGFSGLHLEVQPVDETG
jgi:membrane-bound serine protease (ClpP class)